MADLPSPMLRAEYEVAAVDIGIESRNGMREFTAK
jgi:hypothetical protein